MTIDPLVVVAALGAMGGLLLFIVRLFATGAILPKSAVPREDYEALRAINAAYPEAIKLVVGAITKLTVTVDRIDRLNNGRK